MRHLPALGSRLLFITLALGASPGLQAQVATPPLLSWDAALGSEHVAGPSFRLNDESGAPLLADGATRSHTRTGLLIGGIVGVAATTVFLVGFCGDPDTVCGVDEVGRAVLFIAVPCAALGALIGSLVRTET